LDQDGLCVEGSWGADLFVERVPGSVGVRKYRFDIWQPQAFGDALVALDVQRLIVGGVALRCGVLYAVLGPEERGYRYVVRHDVVSRQDHDEAVGALRHLV
jgi:nicotinamidase-related amidase